MRWILTLLSVIAVAVCVVVIVFFSYGREKSWERLAGPPEHGDIDLMTVGRSRTANDAMAATEGLRSDVDIVLPAYQDSPPVLLESLAARIETADPLAYRVVSGSNPEQLRYITYSPIMRFPDLVTVQTVARDDGMTGLIIYVQAQLGRNDFGANLRRVESYLGDR